MTAKADFKVPRERLVEAYRAARNLRGVAREHGVSHETVRVAVRDLAPELMRPRGADPARVITSACVVCGTWFRHRESRERRVCSNQCARVLMDRARRSDRPRMAYEARARQGLSWRAVAALLGYESALAVTVARGAARRWAEANDLPWPPLPRHHRGREDAA